MLSGRLSARTRGAVCVASGLSLYGLPKQVRRARLGRLSPLHAHNTPSSTSGRSRADKASAQRGPVAVYNVALGYPLYLRNRDLRTTDQRAFQSLCAQGLAAATQEAGQYTRARSSR